MSSHTLLSGFIIMHTRRVPSYGESILAEHSKLEKFESNNTALSNESEEEGEEPTLEEKMAKILAIEQIGAQETEATLKKNEKEAMKKYFEENK